MGDEKGGRFREWRSRVSDRLARSSRVFLLGVIVACGVEVMTDWGATLNEINALRTNVRHKGENYVGILGKPSQSALRARDTKELERISDGVFDDEDAAVVRYYDATGKVVFEHVRPEYASTFELHRPLYDHLMERDVSGMLSDPASYKARVKNSRYRDFSQIWTDFTARLSRIVSAPSPPRVLELIVFQDRLRDENHAQTDRVAWAVGVLRDDTDKAGAVVVMFDMRKTNAAVRAKYIKGLGVLAFFLALIVVQNIIARRDKLRLLDLQTRYGNAKSALREALPEKNLETRGIRVAGRLEQAKGPVDGMAWFVSESGERIIVLVVDPDGDGIDAASVGLHMIKVFRARCEAGVANLDDEVTALGAATTDIPLTRPVGLTLVALDPATGAYDARTTAFGTLRMLGGPSPTLVRKSPVPDGVVGPLSTCDGTLSKGSSLLVFCAGLGEKEGALEGDALARYLERAHDQGAPLPVDDAATWARGRSPALAENDIAIVAITRA